MLIEKDQLVYVIYSNTVVLSKITDIMHDVIFAKHLHAVDRNGDYVREIHGRSGVLKNDIFETYEAAYAKLDNEENIAAKAYMDNIKSVEDLIRFPLIHDFGCEEQTDTAAITAYKTMAAKFGFNVEDL